MKMIKTIMLCLKKQFIRFLKHCFTTVLSSNFYCFTLMQTMWHFQQTLFGKLFANFFILFLKHCFAIALSSRTDNASFQCNWCDILKNITWQTVCKNILLHFWSIILQLSSQATSNATLKLSNNCSLMQLLPTTLKHNCSLMQLMWHFQQTSFFKLSSNLSIPQPQDVYVSNIWPVIILKFFMTAMHTQNNKHIFSHTKL